MVEVLVVESKYN